MRQLDAYVVNESTLNCKWADGRMGGIKTKSTGSPAFISLQGHARLASLADFLVRPTPLGIVFAG